MNATVKIALYALYAVVLVYVSWTDLRTRRIPNVVIAPAILVALLAMPFTVGSAPALAGAVVATLPLALGRLFTGPGQLGMGDIKLAVFVGLILGYPYALWGMIAALALNFGVGLFGMAQGKYTWRSKLPFAPFLAVGALPLLLLLGSRM